MSVSKRLRYEILRRDGFSCRYCGAKPEDDAELHVDHVVPRALGGDDQPSNLASACQACNSGKSSTAPDASTVAEVGAANDRFRDAVTAAVESEMAQLAEWRDDLERWEKAWNAYRFDPDGQDVGAAETVDHRNAVMLWLSRGMTVVHLVNLIPIAMEKSLTGGGDARWRYYCGVVWNTIRRAEESL